MKAISLGLCAMVLCTSCTTMGQSFELGAATGILGGGLASYVGHTSANGKAGLEQVAMGAGIGLGVGLITAFFIHRSVAQDRADGQADETEMHFGDLPPSPFVVPKLTRKKAVSE
jgi:hypothetical protein